MSKLVPLYDKLLVERCREPEMNASGIIIPETVKEKPSQGFVIACGQGLRNPHTGQFYGLMVSEGDKILFGKYSGTEIKVDGSEYLMLREEDILAIIEGDNNEIT